jgi:glutamate synthase (NADPH/NADH) small chain
VALGLPPVYPIMREHLRRGNHVTLISGFSNGRPVVLDRCGRTRRPGSSGSSATSLDVIYTSNDGTFGLSRLRHHAAGGNAQGRQDGSKGRDIAEVVTIGPPLMMRAVSDLTREPYGVNTVASLNSIMVDATGMCGACMVPVNDRGQDRAQARVHRRPGDR